MSAWQGTLGPQGAESISQLTVTKKAESQSYSCKGLQSANKQVSLEKDPELQKGKQHGGH